MNELKDAALLLRMAHQGLINAGINTSSIYNRCGVSHQHFANHHYRTPYQAQAQFWQAAEKETGNRVIGLLIGRKTPVFNGQVMEYLFLSSPTFGEGLQKSLNCLRLLSDSLSASITQIDKCCKLSISLKDAPDNHHFIDALLLTTVRFFSKLTNSKFKPISISLTHSDSGCRDKYQDSFQCPVIFHGDENAITFPADILALPSPHAEPELLQLHEKLAQKQISELEKRDIIQEVNQVINAQLDTGTVSLQTVSSQLGMTPRVLRSRLHEANSSFNRLLNHQRSHLARRLLVHTNESIDEIVYLTGFSEPSTFYRAFKRWTAQTPVEYRRQRQQQAAPEARVSG